MPQTYIKFWPAEYHSQSSIDAALQLRPAVGDVAHVRSITIHTFEAAYNIIGKYPEQWRPQTRETADHSMAYCTAVALMDGEVTDRQFEHDRFTDPAMLELVAKVKIVLDNQLTSPLSARHPEPPGRDHGRRPGPGKRGRIPPRPCRQSDDRCGSRDQVSDAGRTARMGANELKRYSPRAGSWTAWRRLEHLQNCWTSEFDDSHLPPIPGIAIGVLL